MNKIVKRILIISGAVLGTVVLAAGCYVGYIFISYNRLGNKTLKVDSVSTLNKVEVGTEYKAVSYNIGFGAKQIEELNTFLKEKKDNGDYVVIGGDWNHELLSYNPDFNPLYTKDNVPFGMTKKTPDWIAYWFNDDKTSPLIEGYKVIASDNTPTCRNNDIEYDSNKTYQCVVDGFIVSENIQVVAHENIQTKNGNKGLDGFAFSDHDPASITFKLM